MNNRFNRALILTIIVVGGGIWFLHAVSEILLPFVVGLVLAYLLNPLVSLLDRWGIPRALGSTILVSGTITLLVVALVLGMPLLIDQLTSFVQRLPVYLMTLQHFVIPEKLSRMMHLQLTVDALLRPLGMMGTKSAAMTAQALQKTLSGAMWLINIGLLVVMTPLVSFYLLMDWPHLMGKIMEQVPKRWRKITMEMAHAIDIKLAAYLRGMVGVCLCMAVFYACALSSIGPLASILHGEAVDGLEMAWAIGIMTGILVFLPVIGATVGVATMFAVALVQYQLQIWEPYVLIAVIFVIGQILEGYVMTPLMVGNRVGLHPLWVIFALLCGGTLGGITGMLLAIPVAVVVSVVLPRLLGKWRDAVE